MSTQEAPSRPVLRYHGGKWLLAPWIIRHFPAHRIYVEPFGGAGSVLLRKPRSYSEVYNDIDGEVVNVFRVLRDPEQAAKLHSLLELTPFARDEARHCRGKSADPLEQARRTIAGAYLSYGSRAGATAATDLGYRCGSASGDTAPADEWMSYPEQVARYVARLRGVMVESRPAVDLVPLYDGPLTLFYADPPYPHDTRQEKANGRCYAHEMTDADHRALAQVLREVAGMVVLSGYPCPLYDVELFPDWRRVTRKALADGARERVEVLWMNAACVAGLRRRQGELGL